MPNHAATLDRVFRALSSPTRREMVSRLGQGPASMSELAEPFDMALPSILQHLQGLESDGLVTSTKVGRVRLFRLNPKPLLAADAWMEQRRSEWESRLDRLDDFLLKLKEAQHDSDQP